MRLNEYLRNTFGCKVYKISLNGGFTCPNRDGTIDTRGCIFCSAGGSGDFAESPTQSVTEQIEAGKARVAAKMRMASTSLIFRPLPIPMDRWKNYGHSTPKPFAIRILWRCL